MNTMNKTLITAHNGADGRTEGSMDYVRYALSTDADAIEIDIRRLPDGALVFTHDVPALSAIQTDPAATVTAEGNRNPSDDVPGAATPLVLIEDIFRRAAGTSKRVNCDLKEAGLETVVYDLAKKCGVDRQLIYSGTVSAARCQETGLNRMVRIALNIEEYVPDLYARCAADPAQTVAAAKEISEVCRRYGIECVNANYRLATDGFLDILEKNGLGLSVWTVDDPVEAARFLRRGVENVTTRNLRGILPLKHPDLYVFEESI